MIPCRIELMPSERQLFSKLPTWLNNPIGVWVSTSWRVYRQFRQSQDLLIIDGDLDKRRSYHHILPVLYPIRSIVDRVDKNYESFLFVSLSIDSDFKPSLIFAFQEDDAWPVACVLCRVLERVVAGHVDPIVVDKREQPWSCIAWLLHLPM